MKSAYLAQVLPLGISFFTFTQLMYLTDLYRGRAKLESPFVYGAFVTLYPHLPAGPLYHYSEIMPQLKTRSERPLWEDLSVGWTIFVFGLAKKTLADRFAPIADATFSAPADGLTVYAAWSGVLAYSLQIYFDFSGYTDMAIGIARMFGIVFPENFRSPYKATDIIDFWRRWHMTLSRFLRDYVYIPLGGNRRGEARRFVNILLTMLIGGLWHGANWTFILWGALHGIFLVINHAWKLLPTRITIPTVLSIAVTFCCVTLAWVPFRARDLEQTATIFQVMLGIGASPLPITEIHPYLANPSAILASAWLRDLAWLCVGVILVWGAPNTQEIMRAFHPVLGSGGERPTVLQWVPQWRWAVTMAAVFGLCLTQVSTAKVFLYWTF
jgi:D-alanyl-lipoteichoic acid acyltransferase DltB (MBOAT superfamily)